MTTFKNNGYNMAYVPEHPRAYKSGTVLEHRLIAERVLGKPLPKGVEIHHHGARDDNAQIVICENRKYHALLHTRTRALRACGHANWRKCRFCKQWDKPESLYISPNNQSVHHLKCFNVWQQKYRG